MAPKKITQMKARLRRKKVTNRSKPRQKSRPRVKTSQGLSASSRILLGSRRPFDTPPTVLPLPFVETACLPLKFQATKSVSPTATTIRSILHVGNFNDIAFRFTNQETGGGVPVTNVLYGLMPPYSEVSSCRTVVGAFRIKFTGKALDMQGRLLVLPIRGTSPADPSSSSANFDICAAAIESNPDTQIFSVGQMIEGREWILPQKDLAYAEFDNHTLGVVNWQNGMAGVLNHTVQYMVMFDGMDGVVTNSFSVTAVQKCDYRFHVNSLLSTLSKVQPTATYEEMNKLHNTDTKQLSIGTMIWEGIDILVDASTAALEPELGPLATIANKAYHAARRI